MRSFRLSALLVVVAMVTPNVFARICHPKKPITCGAASLSQPAVVAKPAVKAAKTHSPASRQAMACGPWVRTFPYCATTTLAETVKAHSPANSQLAMACGPWVRTFPYCAAKTLAPAKDRPTAKVQPMACGPWVRTFPYCAAKTLG